MATPENLHVNIPESERHNPAGFESARQATYMRKGLDGSLIWDAEYWEQPVLGLVDMSLAPPAEADGLRYVLVNLTGTTVNAGYDGATQNSIVEFDLSSSVWNSVEPSINQIIFDSDTTTQYYFDGTQWTSLAGGGTTINISGTPADNDIAVWTNANTLEGDSNFTWDGIKATVASPTDNDYTEIHNNFIANYREGNDSNLNLHSYGTASIGAEIQSFKYRNTIAIPQAIQNNDLVSAHKIFGYDGTSIGASGLIEFRASENWTSTNQGMYYTIDTNASGENGTPTERFRIDTDGAIKFNNAYKFPTTDGSANQVLKTNGTGTLSFQDDSGVTATSGSSTQVAVFDGTDSIVGNSNLIFSAGSLGIGTSPSVELHVKGNQSILRLESTSVSGNNYLEFYDTTARKGYVGYGSSDNRLLILNDELNEEIQFYTTNSGGSAVKAVDIDGSQNVQIPNGYLGVSTGVTPTVPIHAKNTGEVLRLETPATSGDNYFTFHDSAQKGLVGYESGSDNLIIENGEIGSSIIFKTAHTGAGGTTFNGLELDGSGDVTMAGVLTTTGGIVSDSSVELNSTTEALQLSRWTDAQQTTNIGSYGATEKGEVWFNTTSNSFIGWDGSSTVSLAPRGETTVKTFDSNLDITLYADSNIEINWDVSSADVEFHVLTNPSAERVHLTAEVAGTITSVDGLTTTTPANIDGLFSADEMMDILINAPGDSSYPSYHIKIKRSNSTYYTNTPFLVIATKYTSYD